MYNKNLWKPIFAGTLALTMALSPAVIGRSVSAAEPEEMTTEAENTEDSTTEEETTYEEVGVTEGSTEETEYEEIPELDQATSVPINSTTFPDSNFRSYVLSEIDINRDSILSTEEINATKQIDVYKKNISSLRGIEYFVALDTLNCYENSLTSLNVSKNVQLTTLRCQVNNLTSLDVSKNTELTLLYCSDANLTYLDVSKNIKLKELHCSNNNLNNLDVSKNAMLANLACEYCKLTSLDVSKNVNLEKLFCSENQLSKLDVSKNVNLTCLRCELNQLKTIDVNSNTKLSELYCYNNQLTGLNVSKNKKLTVLDCSENPTLKSINVTNNPMLTTLYCDTTGITSLNISKNTELKFLACAYNKLTSLDLSKQTKLIFLKCEDNQIRTLDVSKNTQLQTLLCYYNQFAYLDLSKNTCISEFKADGNVYTVTTNSKHRIDLTTIPGFQVSKVSNVSGGTIAGTILTFKNGVNVVSYTYDCGNGLFETFMIKEAGSLTPTEEFCTRLYTLCLGRSAEQSGITYWSEQLNSKKLTGAQIGYNFVFSDEYKKKNTSDEAYVKMLYTVFMDRNADRSGLNYWLDLLNQGMSREYVYKGFAESKEFTNICASYGIERGSVKLTQARDQNVNLTKFVNRIYVKAMNRKGDGNGLNYWCNQILTKKTTPVQVAESFIYSKEFTDKNLSNTEYIKVLYRTFMGREADSAGLNYWLGRLNKGDSRKTVLKAFAGCQEFKNIVKSFGL